MQPQNSCPRKTCAQVYITGIMATCIQEQIHGKHGEAERKHAVEVCSAQRGVACLTFTQRIVLSTSQRRDGCNREKTFSTESISFSEPLGSAVMLFSGGENR